MTIPSFDDARAHVEGRLEAEIEARDAAAVAHVGTGREPTVRYLLSVADVPIEDDGPSRYAVAYDAAAWTVRSSPQSGSHPAITLAESLPHRESATILTPADIPHDAALHLESAGFDLASTAVLERARTTKTTAERDRIERAQAAASAGIRRAASVLASATGSDGTLVTGGDNADERTERLTTTRLRRAIDEAIVAAGGFPDANTRIEFGTDDEACRPGEPIVVSVAPHDPEGYYGGLARTFVVEGEGGRDRRAHVGVTHAFRSSRAMLTADSESVTAVEADLEAEVRAFGFGEADDVATDVSGLGLEPREPPLAGGDVVGPENIVRLEAAARLEGERWVRVADVLAIDEGGPEWLEAPSRALEPAALLE
ncbi:peptidase M24 [Salinadaptatus halalkaliphilus]|uniref:Peptidase M24 n=1 Tax=Salinadaptatus halalkaliphilus TaxID=2419781 RepID=A0A4S3TLM4_9EURY|nr:M24 family metallopeptidase [Salinadaptatus halalkaliphilus]THE65081.1 peptidase M24 [Salinadaptatus halalkaliphilus]